MASLSSSQDLNWRILDQRKEKGFHFFNITSVDLKHPISGKKRRFYQLSSRDWVNVFGVTSENKLVIIELFRFGTLACSIETPGGVIEEGEPPIEAAKREFQEETGYRAGSMKFVGKLAPNPAVNTNIIHYYYATKLKQGLPATDEDEIINVSTVPIKQFETMIAQGKVSHGLVVAGYFLLKQHLKEG